MSEPNTPTQNPSDKSKDKPQDIQSRIPRMLFDLLVYFWIGAVAFSFVSMSTTKSIPYSEFLSDLKKGQIVETTVTDTQIVGNRKVPNGKTEPFATTRVDPAIAQMLESSNVKFTGTHESVWSSILFWAVTGIAIFTVLGMSTKKMGFGEGALSPLSIERNKARIYSEENIKVTFADVAGVDEAKEELQEVISFLKDPKQYGRLGGRLPKGILLVGPPGTGKTLLARAVAGEAAVPFFSISGSEFVELFVGVGAARVRDLFAQARKQAPCIIFIDELDALGRSRSINPMISHDEKEQTLNQLLVEMDGFDTSSGVVLLAATNRPEILDQALLRAGRFDRHVVVDRPDKKGRAEILAVHLKKVIAEASVDLEAIAALTAGFTGADLANVVNEAALLASRRKADNVTQSDFRDAIERTIAGLEKKNRILTEAERRVVAFHEMGHALVGMSLSNTEKVEKVSIIPRGIAALGYTVQRPKEDRFILSRTELENKLSALLGGRAAELMIFGEASTGAADDLSKATDLARSMITRYGMDNQLGLAVYDTEQGAFIAMSGDQQLRQGVSPDTAREIDEAVKNMLFQALDRAQNILQANREWLAAAAERLLVDETLSEEQITALKPAAGEPAELDESAVSMTTSEPVDRWREPAQA